MTKASLRVSSNTQGSSLAGRYELGERLGEGGMGVVYRATETATGRVVALKQLLASMAGTKRASAEALFEREYHTLVRLKHPRIIEVYDYGLTEVGPYYTMELLAGQDLVKAAPLSVQDVCRHLRDIASSLALVHAHRLVHRDVSPRNVRLTADGRAKLIDFGALVPFGSHTEIIGTPTCMAPEILRCQPLDQRTDLYALGAVAYWALTRRNAYPARRLDELEDAWAAPPPPPSELTPGIPPELDALILSLLSLDPMARPVSAAVVIDKLTVIGELTPEDHEQAAEHYLHSGRMVGRSAELDVAAKAVARVVRGTGVEIVIDGAPGIGKTRLLHEISLEAQLKGITVLQADAEAYRDPFGVAVALGLHMLRRSSNLARRCAEPHAGVLAHLAPELRQQLGDPALAVSSPLHAEHRARLQAALYEWFLAFARAQPLMLAIDNLQVADDNSAAFLAALGRTIKRQQLMVVVTQRSGQPAAAPLAVKALRQRSSQIRLGALTQPAVDELVGSLFGHAANAGRLAKLLFERSAGNPRQCMDLARILVKKQIAKYVGGTWVLPLSVSIEELPSRTEEVAALRVANLGTVARRLLGAFAVHEKPLPLERCLSLLEGVAESELFTALDELVAEQIVVRDDLHYRVSQDSLREALLLQMSETERKALHLRTAEALLANDGGNIGDQVEAAFHLMRAGDETRGAELTATATRAFMNNQGVPENPARIVEALHMAAMIYETQKRSEQELATLLFPLVALGFYIDWHVTFKYADRAVDIGLRINGLNLAHKLRPFTGRRPALLIGHIVAARQLKKHPTTLGRAYDLPVATGAFLGMIPAIVGAYAICYDHAGLRRTIKALEPIRSFGNDHFASYIHDFAAAHLPMSESRELEARQAIARLIQNFEKPHVAALLGEAHFKAIFGGVLNALGLLSAYEFGDETLAIAQRMDDLGIRMWASGADQLRLLYHSHRGESERVQYYRERVELHAVQGGTTWQSEVFWPVLLLTGDALAGDTIGVRRLAEQLTRRAQDVPGLAPYASAAHATYLSLRGNLANAIGAFERLLPQLPIRGAVAWHTVRSFYADALNRAGEHQRAKVVAQEVLNNMVPGEEKIVLRFLEAERQLAIAEAGLGNHESALKILDKLLSSHGSHDNHLLLGLLHKTRAEVAFNLGDLESAERHVAEMDRRFRATKNPAAIAQVERMLEKLPRRHALPAVLDKRDHPLSVLTQKIYSELSAADDPYSCALALVSARPNVKAVYLYTAANGGLSLVAASSRVEPPMEFELELRQRVQRASTVHGNDAVGAIPKSDEPTCKEIIPSTPPPRSESSHEVILLTTSTQGSDHVVGGLIVEAASSGRVLEPHFVEAIASGLADLLVHTVTQH